MPVWSRYTRLFHRDGEYFLYCSLTNSFANIDEELYGILSDVSEMRCGVDSIPENCVADLLRMKALVNDDNTEFLKIKYNTHRLRFHSGKLSLTICPTLACNFRCHYCFEQQHQGRWMSDNVENDIITFIKSHKSAEAMDVTWFGGEPLLYFDRICSLTDKLKALDLHYRASIVTNGYLLTHEKAERFKELSIGTAQITIDGMRESHDRRRHLSGGGGSFDRIIENIMTAVEVAPALYISIRVNIDGDNHEEYVELFNFLKSKNLPRVSIYPAFVTEYGESFCGYALDSATRKNLLMKYSRATSETYLHFYPQGKRMECAVRNPNSYVIGPDGEIYKCWNDVGDGSKVVSDIKGKIMNESLLLQYLSGADPFESDECRACILLPVCSGGCVYDRMKAKCISDICPLLKTNLDEFLWLKSKKRCL